MQWQPQPRMDWSGVVLSASPFSCGRIDCKPVWSGDRDACEPVRSCARVECKPGLDGELVAVVAVAVEDGVHWYTGTL